MPAESLRAVSRWLTVVAMVVLGLEVRFQAVRRIVLSPGLLLCPPYRFLVR